MTDPAARHISPQTLDEYIRAKVPAAVPIMGDPTAQLVIDAANETLQLEVSWDGEEPPTIIDYVHLSTSVHYRQGRNWARLSVFGTQFFIEAYPLLCLVADLVQLQSRSFAVAVQAGLSRYHELLSAPGRMPVREEIGLYGELLTLSHFVSTLGPESALSAWCGGDFHEEHDFVLPNDDIEVKTTTAESRRHWIGSIDQLEPTLNRSLWLVSIQVTGAGASDGHRLPDLVSRVVGQLPATLHDAFKNRLAATHFRAAQPPDSFRLLRLRSGPLCYPVNASFPRVTRGLLRASGAQLDRIEEISYTVRLDGIAPAKAGPEPLRGFAWKGNDQT